jgi:ribonuclease D
MRGCIFDFTEPKEDRRILVSNHQICSVCRDRPQELESIIKEKTETDISFNDTIKNALYLKWMGRINKTNSPLYNLKKNYRYDINRDSGFNKTRLEKLRDLVKDNASKIIVEALIIIATALILNLLGLNQ